MTTKTYRWCADDHDPLDGNHTESPYAITVVLNTAMQQRIEVCREMLGQLSRDVEPFGEGGVMSMMLRFTDFTLTDYDGKVRTGLLEVSRTWVYLNFYNEWNGEQYELPLTDDLLQETQA